MKSILCLVLFAVICTILAIPLFSQNLAVYSSPSNSGSNITVTSGVSFTLELSYTMPVGCTTAEFDLTLPTGPLGAVIQYQSVTGNQGSGWSYGGASGGSATFSGDDPAGNTQSVLIGYKTVAGSNCDGSQLQFQGSIRFYDAQGNICAAELPTNVATVNINAPHTRTCSASLLVPDPACGEDLFAVEVSIPSVPYYGWQKLDATQCILSLSGTPSVTAVGHFNQYNQVTSVPFTTSVVGGVTEVDIQWFGLSAWYAKDIVVYYTYNCVNLPSAFTYQAEIRATDPCTNAAYVSGNTVQTVPQGVGCCQSTSASIPPDLVISTGYGSVCRGSCDEQTNVVTFNNYGSGTPLYDPQVCITIPEGLTIASLTTNAGGSWVNGPITVEAYDPVAMVYVPITSLNPINIPFTYTDLEICVTYTSGMGPTFPVSGGLFFNYTADATADPNETIQVSLTDNSQSFSVSGQNVIPIPSCNPIIRLYTQVRTTPSGASLLSATTTVLAVPNDKRTYQYRLSNASGTSLSGVTFTDVLPANVTACPNPARFYQSNGSPIQAVTPSTLAGAFNAGSLVVNQTANQFSFGPFDLPDNCDTNWQLIVELDVEVAPQTPIGNIPNTFTLSGGGFSQISYQGNISVQKHYSLEGEVLVDCALPSGVGQHNPTDSTQVSAGSPVVYTYLVRNTGNIPVENVRMFSSLARSGDTESGNCGMPRGSTMEVRYGSITPPLSTGLSNISSSSSDVYTTTGTSACSVSACAPTAALGSPVVSADIAYAELQGLLYPGDEVSVKVIAMVDASALAGDVAKQDFQFCAYRPDINQDVPPGVSTIGTVILGQDTCSTRDPFKCPREFLIDRGNCCYELELIPELPKGPDSIVINISGLGFNGVTVIDPNFTIVSQSNSSLSLVANSQWTNATVPVEICFGGSGMGALTIEYYCTEQMVSCSQTLAVSCSAPTLPCLSALKGDVQCDPVTGDFYFEFCYLIASGASVQNFDLISSLPVTASQTPQTFMASGVSATEINYDYFISGNMPSNVCGFRVNLPSAVPGQALNFQLVGSDSTGTVSCLDTLWNGTLTIPPVCNPGCDEGYEVELLPTTGSPGEACYTVLVNNQGPTTIIDHLTIEAPVGILVLSSSASGGYATQQMANAATWFNATNPLLGFPVGNSSLGTVCYAAPGPGQLTINYQDGQDVLCADSLVVDDLVALPCLATYNLDLECVDGTGSYQLNVAVDNPGGVAIGGFGINLQGHSWNTILTNGVNVQPGATNVPLVFTLPTGVLNPAGGLACFVVTPLLLNGEGKVIGECGSEVICVEYGDCGDELGCGCGDWDYFQLGTNKGKKDISCGMAYEAPCQTPLVLEGQYACQGEDCEPAGYDLSITYPNGKAAEFYISGPVLDFEFPALADGIYLVELFVDCGGMKCVCEFQVLIDCDDCIGYVIDEAISLDDLDLGSVVPGGGYVSTGVVVDAAGNLETLRSFLSLDYSSVPRDARIVSATLNLEGNISQGAYADKSIRPRNSSLSNDLLLFPVRTPTVPFNELKWDSQPTALLSPDSLRDGGLFVEGPHAGGGVKGVNLLPILEQLADDRRELTLGLRLFEERSSGDRVAAFSAERRSLPLERAQCQICYTRTSSTVIAPVANDAFELSPNPVQTTLTLSRESMEATSTVRVVDLYGRTVKQMAWAAGGRSLALDVNDLVPGTYLVLVDSKNGTRLMAQKVVVVE